MDISGTFVIEKPAKSKGGDRYKGQLSNEYNSELSTVYIPQTISRDSENRPFRRIKIKIICSGYAIYDGVPNNDTVTVSCHLKKAAKSGGGDRYDGKVKDETLSIYISQCFSRSKLLNVTSNDQPVKEAHVIFSPMKSPSISSCSEVLSSPSINLSAQKYPEVTSLGKRDSSSLYLPESNQGISRRGRNDRLIDVDDDEVETKSRNPEMNALDPNHQVCSSLQEFGLQAYLHEQYDDAIVEKISDSSGNFSLETYLKIRMANGEF